MNNRLRRRLVVVTGVIVMVIVVVLAVVGAATGYETVTVAQATSGSFNGSRVQVTGKVVDNSYSLEGDVLSFSIYEDAEGTGTTGAENARAVTDAAGVAGENTRALKVVYDKGFSATFGNQVEAICTGTIGTDGVLKCTELVTKCPSKYESSVDALTVSQLLSYDRQIIDKPVKVIGKLKAGTLATVGRGDRFVLVDADEAGAVGTAGAAGAADTANTATSDANELPVRYEGALSDEIQDGTTLVLTGSLNASGRFEATDVALKG